MTGVQAVDTPAADAVDVLVVGGGAAGTVAAAGLARRGLRTLLVDASGADAAHDVVLSGPARAALSSLGGWDDSFVRPVEVLDLWFGVRTRRVIADSRTAVCDRSRLVDSLRRTASKAGAVPRNGKVLDLRRISGGHRVTLADGTTIDARHVVLATGPRDADTSRLICAQRFTAAEATAGPGGRIVLQLVTPATDDPKVQPSCAWVLPGNGGGFTVGAIGGKDARTLIAEAFAGLAEVDPRLAGARPDGPVRHGPADSGFAPEHTVDEDRLIVGDAAGLINPFTGEGLSYAVQSGLLAAAAIAEHPDDTAAAARAYSRELTRTFVGYFETAQHAARRYHLAWRVLADAPSGAVEPLREFGRHCGRAFVHAEDVLALRGSRTRLDTSLTAMIEARTSSLPGLLGAPDLTAARLAADPRMRDEALASASAACREALDLARKAAAEVAEETPARILSDFATATAAPALEETLR